MFSQRYARPRDRDLVAQMPVMKSLVPRWVISSFEWHSPRGQNPRDCWKINSKFRKINNILNCAMYGAFRRTTRYNWKLNAGLRQMLRVDSRVLHLNFCRCWSIRYEGISQR
jgi:hypothetical protein